MVKDETQFDRFDLAFSAYFGGIDSYSTPLRRAAGRLDPPHRAPVERRGEGEDPVARRLEKLMEVLKERLAEQKKRHEGATSGSRRRHQPLRNSGYNPEGIRIAAKRNKSAVKVWKSANSRISTAAWNWVPATSRWRCAACGAFAREGAADQFRSRGTSLPGAQRRLARHPCGEPANAAKVLLMLGVGARWTRM